MVLKPIPSWSMTEIADPALEDLTVAAARAATQQADTIMRELHLCYRRAAVFKRKMAERNAVNVMTHANIARQQRLAAVSLCVSIYL
jgi:hypothetical protein